MADMLTTIVNSLEFYVLKEIEKDLDYQEKISMIFLMGDYRKSIDLLNPINEETILSEFVAKNKYKWREKCLEALYLINNRRVLKKLGLEDGDLEKLVMNFKTISPVIISLYKLCESLTDDEAKQLLRKINHDLHQTVDNVLYLETYILNWINKKYIFMKEDGTWYIKDIMLQHLKNLNRDNIYTSLIKSAKEKFLYDRVDTNESTITINKALCVIINQINFGKYEIYDERIGSNADAKKLKETFESFGFEVSIFSDLTKNQLLDTMKNLSENFGTEWDCLFFCILSHGNEGTIVTSDEKEISLQTIDDCICTPKLLNVMKIVIIQACQGEKKGISINKLRIDGPCVNNKIAETSSKTNFCIFMSTMSGFISVRHQEDGSWFIQTLCKVLEEKENITFSEFTREVTKRTKDYRGTVDDIPSVTQLPELIKSRFMKDFKFPSKKIFLQ